MKVRFQADADLRQPIVRGARRREPGIDFRSAVEAGLIGLDDQQVLAVAAAGGRVLVSQDFRTMPSEFARFLETGPSPGLTLVSRNLPISTAIEEIILIWTAIEAEELVNQMVFLPI